MKNKIKLIYYFLNFLITKKNTPQSYEHMRKSYMVYHLWRYFDLLCYLNRLIRRKYNIKESNGVIGKLTNDSVNKITSSIEKDGFYIFNQKLSEDEINQLFKFSSETPLNYLDFDNGKNTYSENKIIYKNEKLISNRYEFIENVDLFQSEVAKNLFFDENFLHIANEYLQSKPILDIFTIWWSRPLSELPLNVQESMKDSAAQMFHYDMDRLKFLKFFIYLTDVTEESGPHVYVKKSHIKPSFFINSDGRYDDKFIYSKFGEDVIELIGKRGTIIAVDTRGIHKGKEILKGERLIFQIEFANSLFGSNDLDQYKNKNKYKYKTSMKSKYSESYKLFINFQNEQ